MKRFTLICLGALVTALLGPREAGAQSRAGGRRLPVGETAQQRLRIRAGTLEIIPYLRLGHAGVDTNVFYTQEDRRTDFYANGGPGLQLGFPVRRVRLWLDGNANYYYFARSKDQRHFGGEAGGGFDWNANKFAMGASRFYVRSFDRPSVEVDRRVLTDQWVNQAYLQFDAGNRLRLTPRFNSLRTEVPSATEFLGTDLQRTLTQDRYIGELQIEVRIASKTSFIVLGDQQWVRFPHSAARGVNSNLAAAGFGLSSPTRLSGSVLAGAEFFRPQDVGGGANFARPYVLSGLEWKFGEKLFWSASYRFDTQFSAFETRLERLPTYDRQEAGTSIRWRTGQHLEVILGGRHERLGQEIPVIVRRRATGEQEITRRDRFNNATFDVGWWFWRRCRLGAIVTYNERMSNFTDFGVNGLLLGASVRFNP